MKKFIYTPILKTKEGELLTLKSLKPIFNNDNFINPYIRFIYKKTSRKSKIDTLINFLKDNQILSFLEINLDEEKIYRNTNNIELILSNYLNDNFILTFKLSKSLLSEFDKIIKPFLNRYNMRYGLVLDSGTKFNNINNFLKFLSSFEYLFIDCKTNNFNSVDTYLNNIGRAISININKMVLYEGRKKTTNIDFVKNPNQNMDQSYMINIDTLMKYGFYGVGDYTTVKNDDNPNLNMGGVETIAYLLLYDYKSKQFFCVNNRHKTNIGRAYSELHEIILNDLPIKNAILERLKNTPLTLNQFHTYLLIKKAKSTKYISLGISKYIEEVNNYLRLVN